MPIILLRMRNRSALFLAIAASACSAPTHVDVLAKTDDIKYLLDTGDPPPSWNAAKFDDASWLVAKGTIGPLVADATGVMPAVLTRSLFDLGAQASAYKSLTLALSVPGGYTAYVNGTPMVTATDGNSASLDLTDGLVHETGNTLALEIHPPGSANQLTVAPMMNGKLDPADAGKPHVVRGPWLLHPRTDGISVEWETSAPVASTLIIDGRTLDGGGGAHHHVRVDGLQPSSTYKYHVEVNGEASSEADLVTAPSASERIRFVVYGDNRTDGDAHRLIADAIEKEGPDFLVNTGDLVDSSSNTEWQDFFDIEYGLLRKIPLFPALGNHEANSGGGGRFAELFPVADQRVFSGKVYSADFGDVHLAVLDSNTDMAVEAKWLDGDLTKAEQNGAKHLFIAMHWGPFSGGQMLLHGSNDDARAQIVPVAHRHHVDAMFAGHDHFYERGADGDLAYFVCGGGGAPLEPAGAIAQTQVARSMHHYLVVDIQGAGVTFTAKDTSGAAFDHLAK
jgi:hypothetical protein